MFKRVILSGAGTGIAAALALIYPLYIDLPHSYVSDWPAGQGAISMALVTLAVLIAAAGGAWTARGIDPDQTGPRLWVGGLSGGLAGFMAFGLIGAAAAGVIAAWPVFPVAASQAAFRGSLANSVVLAVWLTHSFMWIMILAGAGAGALGALIQWPGAAAAAAPETMDASIVLNVTLITIMLAAALAMVVSIAIFSLMVESIGKTARENGVWLWLPAGSVAILPTVDLMAMFVISHALVTASLRKILADSRINKAIIANVAASMFLAIGLPIAVLLFVWSISPETVLALQFLPGIVFSLITAGLLIPLVRPTFSQYRAAQAADTNPIDNILARNWQDIALGSSVGLALPGYGIVLPIALNLVLLQIPTISYQMAEAGASAPPAAQLIAELYPTHVWVFGLILIVSAAATAVTTGLMLGTMRWLSRRAAQ